MIAFFVTMSESSPLPKYYLFYNAIIITSPVGLDLYHRGRKVSINALSQVNLQGERLLAQLQIIFVQSELGNDFQAAPHATFNQSVLMACCNVKLK